MTKTLKEGAIGAALGLMLVASLFSSAATAHAANVVVNGDFEAPVVGAPQLWDVFVTAAVSGWTIEWMDPTPAAGKPTDANLELHRGVNGWLPQLGDQYAELDTDWDGPTGSINNEAASVRIYQDVPTTAGCTYALSFWFSPRPGTPASDNVLAAFWDGTQQGADITAAGGSQTSWTQYSSNVVASGATTRIQFEDHGTANSLGTFLDNVSVDEVSCPPPPPPPCEHENVCCSGDVVVHNSNHAKVINSTSASASTGGNVAGGSEGGRGGRSGKAEVENGGGNSANSGNGGAGGDGAAGGLIQTGNAGASAGTLNIVNTNRTRVRR
ncbi:hypothetical protein A2678_03300 [Candidatus Kaiserbacteria bacterium RIFCSPHIGHO2_01_FULL_53_31]|uniref:CBM-cenC domain-containing protein n=1 Tax=Candidatus Kaiserbacteria bacterium RIFCSPHIGHO2_01_FULL_53_31 TaxID=1798481 RepID=A0A1F6CH27_9BACT|nr:MAG: hypothetical protein A2678_03300 [Candidatus Kaiserbacteria bacterium RIFCSPHIGHO2_01_FULL_53_31]